ncbi:MAG: type II secretion system protein [Actinobacteria bacterium]|nr:MAG: type II secretion system protein [Actinomycetota bacterium]
MRLSVVSERGYTLVEMLTVLVIFGTVMSALMVLLVQGTNAEVDMNSRFQAQQDARLALDKIRREAHCASAVTVSSSSSVTLSLPAYCPTGNGSVTWCTASLGTSRYGLFRKVGAACDSTGVRWADHLTSANVFTYAAQSPTSLAKLSVDFPVNVKPSRTVDTYELKDDIVLRNSTRS